MLNIHIGTSGYSYKWWTDKAMNGFCGKKGFYSRKTCQLSEYAKHFDMVELNGTFYRMPSEKTVLKWKKDTPEHFKFLVKVSKYQTHSKKLIDFPKLFPSFFERISLLDHKLKGFLVQLPPSFAYTQRKSTVDDLKPLERLIKAATFTRDNYPGVNFFVEFRHPSWFCSQVYDALRGMWGVVVVNLNNESKSFGKMKSGFSPPPRDFPEALTLSGKIMFRNHGTSEYQAYCGQYSDLDMALMMSLFQDETFVTFDNTDSFQYELPKPKDQMARIFTGEYYATETILPAAVADAKKLKEIM